jgi:3-oxoadipate enol-lactonase/4-carboxymuconolactone decarboxylase
VTRLLHYRIDGPDGAPALILGPSVGTSLAVWDAQVLALARDHRVVRWDLPGHGSSPAELLTRGPSDEPYLTPAPPRSASVTAASVTSAPGAPAAAERPAATVADLGRLVLDLADSLGIDRFGYAGISLGGAVGAWLAIQHPARVDCLTMICSSASFGPAEAWHDRAALVRAKGTEPLIEGTRGRWFTPGFGTRASTGTGTDTGTATTHAETSVTGSGNVVTANVACGDVASTSLISRNVGSGDVERDLVGGLLDDLRRADPEGYAACCDALASYDIRAELASITAPTLVIAGREDPATPPAHARELADGIPGASLVEIAHAAHLANVERPEQVLAALLAHVGGGHEASREAAPGSRYDAGMVVRRAVLGDEHVDRAIANTTDFTADVQDLITRYAWGEIWTRPGLDRRARSCITLTALVAGGHLEELAMHVKAALRNGLTPDEIKEVLLQTAIYCGVPAANAAFAVAQRTLRAGGTGEADEAGKSRGTWESRRT